MPRLPTLEAPVVSPDAAPLEIHRLQMAPLVRSEVHDSVVLEVELPEGVHQRPDALVHLLHVVAVARAGFWDLDLPLAHQRLTWL